MLVCRPEIIASLVLIYSYANPLILFILLANVLPFLSLGNIKTAVFRAASRAALRLNPADRVIRMEDLTRACEEEGDKSSSGLSDAMKSMYSLISLQILSCIVNYCLLKCDLVVLSGAERFQRFEQFEPFGIIIMRRESVGSRHNSIIVT